MKVSDVLASQVDYAEMSDDEIIQAANKFLRKGKQTPTSIGKLWEYANCKYHGYQSEQTIKAKNQLFTAYKKSPEVFCQTLLFVVSEWSGFADVVNSAGETKITSKPTLGSFVSVLDQAITFWLQYKSQPYHSKLPAPSPVVKQVTNPNIPIEEQKPAKGLSEGDVDAAFDIFSDLENNE